MCSSILEIIGIILGIVGVVVGVIGVVVGVIGAVWAIRETQQRKAQGDKMFYFLRGVKTNAVGNQNNTGDTSPSWKALVEQIDDIIRWLQK